MWSSLFLLHYPQVVCQKWRRNALVFLFEKILFQHLHNMQRLTSTVLPFGNFMQLITIFSEFLNLPKKKKNHATIHA